MRRKKLGNQWRMYLNPEDYQTLRDHAVSERADLAIRLGGELGLRVGEIEKVKTGDLRSSTMDEVQAQFLRIWEGKDTTGELDGGKYRATYCPSGVANHMLEYADENDIDHDDPLLGVKKRTLYNDITASAEDAAEATGVMDFSHVSPHDLRAYFATNLLVRHHMNPEVVMEIGGWEDYQSLKPYLSAPSDDVIEQEFVRTGLDQLEDTSGAPDHWRARCEACGWTSTPLRSRVRADDVGEIHEKDGNATQYHPETGNKIAKQDDRHHSTEVEPYHPRVEWDQEEDYQPDMATDEDIEPARR